ncbi:MAG: apolipoprotein N-acyltransferase, partial [Motiliproteus sp.]|nr:apolipoprotein N-acyltransferase [Motiliproteus sp.]
VALAAFLTFIFVCGIALFFAIHAALFRTIVSTNKNSRLGSIWLGFPAAWVLSEWFRSWFLTGFPWIYLGYAPMDSWLGAWAPITGVYGLSFWSALTVSSAFVLVQTRSNAFRIAACGTMVLPWLAGITLSTTTWVKPAEQPPLRIAMIQGNIPQNLKWNPGYRQQIIDTYLKATLQNIDQQLIIWPETAIPLLLDRIRPSLEPLEQRLAQAEVGLITGIPSRESDGEGYRYFNSIVGLATAQGIYHKQRLVPFGEYVPLESMLRGLIRFFDLPMSSFSLGPANQPPLSLANDQKIAAFVCYEIVYPDLVAKDARNADYLLTLSNDSWFGDSLAPHQHLQMARMRALENGRFLVRGTNNGISAIVDPKGRIVEQSPQFVATVLRGEVLAMSGQTPFNRWGSTPVLLICALLAAAILIQKRRQQSTQQQLT